MLRSINLLGVKISSETEDKVLEYVLEKLKNSRKKFFITTPNPEILVYANSHSAYRDKLNEAEVALPDGVGLILAAKLMGKPLKERITGTDFIEKLCKASREPFFHQGKKPISMGFFGAGPGMAEKAAERLKKKYPWIDVVISEAEPDRLLRLPKSLKLPIDILFVAFGHPKQEEWIYENLEKLPVKAAMGVGGAFDYISEEVMRAPSFVRKLGLEWLFRLIYQPWRIRRQLALIKFCFLVLREKFS